MISWIRQAVSVTGVGLRTLPQRPVSSLVAVIGIAGVVLVTTGVLSIVAGLREATEKKSDDEVIIVTRASAKGEMDSGLVRDEITVIEDVAGIARDEQGVLVSPEAYFIVDVPTKASNTAANVVLRGVDSHLAVATRGNVELVEGRWFRSGQNEITVGLGATGEFAGLALGDSVNWRRNNWQVVGIFSANGGVAESEIWADLPVLQSIYRRGSGVSTIRARLQSADLFTQFRDSVTSDPRLSVDAQRENEFYAEQSHLLSIFVRTIGLFIGGLMGLGAIFGAVNTMYTAVAGRIREIATLRALGFRADLVVVSVLVESMLLALVGGLLGGAIAYAIFNGFQVSTLNFESFSQVTFAFAVTPGLLLSGIGYALLLGLLGGLLPALRGARLPITTALREL